MRFHPQRSESGTACVEHLLLVGMIIIGGIYLQCFIQAISDRSDKVLSLNGGGTHGVEDHCTYGTEGCGGGAPPPEPPKPGGGDSPPPENTPPPNDPPKH